MILCIWNKMWPQKGHILFCLKWVLKMLEIELILVTGDTDILEARINKFNYVLHYGELAILDVKFSSFMTTLLSGKHCAARNPGRLLDNCAVTGQRMYIVPDQSNRTQRIMRLDESRLFFSTPQPASHPTLMLSLSNEPVSDPVLSIGCNVSGAGFVRGIGQTNVSRKTPHYF